MRRILICTGILGGGTALTFAVAALAATILPGGRVVPGNPVMMERDWAKPGIAVPVPAPIPLVDPAPDVQWLNPQDTVGGGPAPGAEGG